VHRLPGEEVEGELALSLRPNRARKRRDHRSFADLLRLAFGVPQERDEIADETGVADFDLHLAAGRERAHFDCVGVTPMATHPSNEARRLLESANTLRSSRPPAPTDLAAVRRLG
jgi:hypothetical protein